MEDQALNGPAGVGGAMGDGDVLARRDASSNPGLKQQAKDTVRDAREQVMTEVRERKDEAKQSATRMVDKRTRTLSESMSALASAFDAAAASLGQENQDRLAGWTRELSGRARRMASYLEQQDARGLVNDLEGTAREHPATFVGTSFAAGLAAGRFLRSSSRDDATEQGVDFEFHADPALLSDDTGANRAGGFSATGTPTNTGASGGYGNPGAGFGTTGSAVGGTRTGLGDAGFGPTRTSDTETQKTGLDVNRGNVGNVSTGGAGMASRAAGSAPPKGGAKTPGSSTGAGASTRSAETPARREPNSGTDREGGAS